MDKQRQVAQGSWIQVERGVRVVVVLEQRQEEGSMTGKL